MKLYPTLLAASALLAILGASPARANDGVLTFELEEPQWVQEKLAAVVTISAPAPENQPLPIPAHGLNPPMRYHSPQQLPAGVYRRGVAVALNDSTSATALLPPAPPPPSAAPVLVAVAPPEPEPTPQPEETPEPALLALDFEMAPSPAVLVAQAELAKPQQPANPLLSLFEGDTNSLVAWAVGSAEGTRTPNGAINPAYFGHTDPGNRVWNMGTFSYQHGAKTPAEADQKQLARLKNQGDVLRQRALSHGLNLTLEETLNGLDLANQSPLAAIGRVGYIERLAEAKANGYEGAEAIVVARTRSYINPNTGRWNAPGLGNTEPSIRRDQKRRADAVAKAIAAYEAKDPDLRSQTWTLTPSEDPAPDMLVALAEAPAEAIDEILEMWTSPSDPVAQIDPAVDEQIAAVADEASHDHRLAVLWQITTEKLSEIGSVSFKAPTPQTASLAGVRFARGNALEPTVAETDVAAAPTPAAIDAEIALANHPEENSNPSASLEPETRVAQTDTGTASPSWADVREANQSSIASELEPMVLESVASVEAEAIAPPTWAETREAHQSAPAEPLAAVLPDRAGYSPESTSSLGAEDSLTVPSAQEAVLDPAIAPALDKAALTKATGTLKFDKADFSTP
ncbi:hypothetical protein [Nodosilinea sp. E11]|uniref:hypothetical protein n=1 Tax=Nodosilinea sp. E11 TaxID=3037479 RepID=UPI0029351B27|nr:hypothetical protein [Nodosilinea sp. E11]WOD37490.1 hypothetical protein RRF56_14875 [Nodosilinea sp. E11]